MIVTDKNGKVLQVGDWVTIPEEDDVGRIESINDDEGIVMVDDNEGTVFECEADEVEYVNIST